jgi:hypothetical protein
MSGSGYKHSVISLPLLIFPANDVNELSGWTDCKNLGNFNFVELITSGSLI